MNRRKFLWYSAASVAALACGGAAFQPAYAQSINLTKIKASQLGCILDCDLNTGFQVVGGIVTTNPATDNTAILNAFLALGTADNPVELEIDGASAISGLFLPTLGHASITGFGWDTGFYVQSGSNQDAIHNGGANASIPFNPTTTTPTISGYNVSLRNFRINGNRGNGTNGNSNSGNPKGNAGSTVWYMGVSLVNIQNIRIEDVWFYNIASYNIRLLGCAEALVDGVRVDSPNALGAMASNTDGVHISGSMTGLRVTNSWFQTGDDAIALNAPEGFSNSGNITDVAISNCFFNGCPQALRAYVGVGTSFVISKVVMDNCAGSILLNSLSFCSAILLGNNIAGARSADQIQDISISNCSFSSVGMFIAIADSCGSLNISNTTWMNPTSATWGFISFNGQCNVSSLTTNNCKIYRSTAGSAAAFGLANYGSTSGIEPCSIGKFTLGINVENESGESYAPVADLLKMTSLTIAELNIDALDPTLVTALADSFTGITTIRGAGVAASGLQIPDANMAANVPYISAISPNAGKLCIQHTLGTVVALG